MSRLEQRVGKLEDAGIGGRYGVVVVCEGEDLEAKRAAYIAEHGEPRTLYVVRIVD